MDFDDTPEEAAFRVDCVAWLEANAPRREGVAEVWRTYRPRDDSEDRAALRRSKEWQLRKAEAGFAGIQWPVSYGGQGRSPHHAGVFKTEEARFDVPGNAFQVGVDMVGPTLIEHGTHAQRLRHLDPIRRGEEVWCQLFSEPGAGSDLAGLSTRAIRDGDEFVVNGQKVWTSGAQWADWGILLARTDVEAPKHAGITYLLLDMASPGVEVRPLRQIDGAVHFHEVFLTDVRVPVDRVVGEVDRGWGVAMTTLLNERTAIGSSAMVQFPELLMLVRGMGAASEPCVRQEVARAFTRFEIGRYLGYRVQTSLSQGRPAGPESSVMKLHVSRSYGANSDLFETVMGAAGMLSRDDAPFGGFFQDFFLAQWAPRIGGGTDQVQRNIVAERVLGLPGEPRTDKATPFRELLRS